MYTAKIDASSHNIPTAFDATAGSLIIAGAPSGGLLTVINTTDSILYITFLGSATRIPGSTLPGTCLSIPAGPTGGSGVGAIDIVQVNKGDYIYVRTDNAAARTSGLVVVTVK